MTASTETSPTHRPSTGKSQRCRSSDPQTDSFSVNSMWKDEVHLRLVAARDWIDHALNGECETEDALEAVAQLTDAARHFTDSEVA